MHECQHLGQEDVECDTNADIHDDMQGVPAHVFFGV